MNKLVQSNSSWNKLKEDANTLLKSAFKNPILVFNFLAVIVLCGGLGVWLPNLTSSHDQAWFKANDLLTYGIALLSSMMAESIMKHKNGGDNGKNNNNYKEKNNSDAEPEYNKALKASGLFVGVLAFILLIIGFLKPLNNNSSPYSYIAIFLLYILWLCCNANEDKYKDNQSPFNALGGIISPDELPSVIQPINKLSGEW